VHVHVLAEGGALRVLLPAHLGDSGFSERLDNYGVEGIFEAIPSLTIEARLGRFDGDGLKGPYFGANGFYALDPQIAVTAGFQHSRLDLGGADVDTTDALIGVEYYLPGAPTCGSRAASAACGIPATSTATATFKPRVRGDLPALRPAGAVARTRTFGRQKVLGLF
jgi:hypothetical protein